MKKYLFIFILIFSSFFLFSTNIKAATFNFTMSDDYSLNLIDSNFFVVKEYADNFLLSNSDYSSYLISKRNSDFIVYFFVNNCSYSMNKIETSNSRLIIFFNCNYTSKKYSNNSFSNFISSSSMYQYFQIISPSPYKFRYDTFLYFYDIGGNKITNGTNNILNIVSDYYTDEVGPGDDILSLYDIYLLNSSPPDNYPILTSFYTLVISKLSLISTSFINNYIFLTIFVIFLLIFLIELIRRHFI